MLYRILGTLLGIFIAGMVFILFLKVDTNKENSIPITGSIVSISEGPSFDILIHLQDDPTVYYINRGIESGIDIESLTEALIGDSLTFWVGNQRIGTPRHITHLEHEHIIYSEW